MLCWYCCTSNTCQQHPALALFPCSWAASRAAPFPKRVLRLVEGVSPAIHEAIPVAYVVKQAPIWVGDSPRRSHRTRGRGSGDPQSAGELLQGGVLCLHRTLVQPKRRHQFIEWDPFLLTGVPNRCLQVASISAGGIHTPKQLTRVRSALCVLLVRTVSSTKKRTADDSDIHLESGHCLDVRVVLIKVELLRLTIQSASSVSF